MKMVNKRQTKTGKESDLNKGEEAKGKRWMSSYEKRRGKERKRVVQLMVFWGKEGEGGKGRGERRVKC